MRYEFKIPALGRRRRQDYGKKHEGPPLDFYVNAVARSGSCVHDMYLVQVRSSGACPATRRSPPRVITITTLEVMAPPF